jgi:hypothetical protein
MRSMTPSSENQFSELREEIVAYLDGELTDDQVVVVEQRLSEDESYRHELLQLQRTWDILDQVPRSTASNMFAQSTLEMAALNARQNSSPGWRLDLRWILLLVAIAVSGSGGFLWARYNAEQPNIELARDLELLEEFEMFEEVESIQFLERLSKTGLFPKSDQPGALEEPSHE